MLAARSCAMRLSGLRVFLTPKPQYNRLSSPLLARVSISVSRSTQVPMQMSNFDSAIVKLPLGNEELIPLRALKSDHLQSGGNDGTNDGNNGNDGNGGSGGGGGGGDVPAGRPANPILAWYMKHLEKRPVLTKAITAAALTFVGDLFTQFVIEKSSFLDVKRIAVITSLGFMLIGPTLHYWYLALSKVVKVGGPKGALIRLLFDQLLFSPVFIAVVFVSLLVMEGRPSDIGPKLTQDWPSAVLTNWKLWVPFQFVNFLFVPQQLQVAFANVIALVWNAYLSFATHTHVEAAVVKP